jgi:LAS superfamily LD-carboxypeptidase LdcB
VSSTPNVYLHFHGHRTNYGIDPDLTWDASKHAPKEDAALVDKGGSGHRAAQQAMAAALNKNTVVIMPQGVEGEGSGGRHEGGYMADLEALGLDGFLKKVMGPLGKDLGVDPLTAGHIGLGGHSSGGYEGMHSALRRLKGEDKDIADHITDITLYDANYGSGAHLDETLAWAIKGSPNKNVRLVNGWGQTTTNKKINQTSHDLWFNRFGEAALAHYAKAHGMTVRPVAGAGDRLDKETSVVQHSQIINKDGAVQCDVLILMFSSSSGADHEALRDREIDDAIMSIGEGAAGNATFGHHDKGKLELQNQLKEEHAELKKDQQDHKLQGEPAHPAPDQQVQPPPEHQDGAHAGTHEIAKPATATGSVAAPLEHARKVHKKQEALFDKLYNEKSGDARLSNLGHHSTTTVKEADPQHPGKKIKKTVDINLTDEQYKFKQRVFVKAVERAGDGLFGGVPKDKLDPIAGSDGQHIRKEVTSDLNAMIAAAKAEVGVTLTVASGYRDIKEEMGLWNHAFDTIYLWMEHKTREAMFPGDPYGDAAAAWLAEKIASRKAVPGTSNHSNGIAVDLTGPGLDIGYDNQTGWRGSSVYKWLNGLGEFQGRGAAKRFNFQNYHKEAWHYDWRGKLDE